MNPELDLSRLTEEDIGHLEFVLSSPSYSLIFRPFLARIREDYLRLLLNPSKSRAESVPDDYLRGGVAVIDTLLTMFEDIRTNLNTERVHNAMLNARPTDDFERRMASGLVKPPTLVGPPADEDY